MAKRIGGIAVAVLAAVVVASCVHASCGGATRRQMTGLRVITGVSTAVFLVPHLIISTIVRLDAIWNNVFRRRVLQMVEDWRNVLADATASASPEDHGTKH